MFITIEYFLWLSDVINSNKIIISTRCNEVSTLFDSEDLLGMDLWEEEGGFEGALVAGSDGAVLWAGEDWVFCPI